MKPHILLSATFLLSSCGVNQVRIESASGVVDSSKAVVNVANQSLAEYRLQRAKAVATLVASDTSCRANPVIYIRLATAGPFCTDTLEKDANGNPAAFAFDTRPIPEALLLPTITLTAALADYAAVLEKIVAAPKVDVTKELQGVADKANQAAVLFEALNGSGVSKPVLDLSTDQAKAALALAQFAADLAQNQAKVNDIKRAVRAKDPEIASISGRLKVQVIQWVELAGANADTTSNRLTSVYNDQVRLRPKFEDRLAFLDIVQASRANAEQVKARQQALVSAIDALDNARARLNNNLANNLSPADRANAQKYSREQIAQALKLLATAATAFI